MGQRILLIMTLIYLVISILYYTYYQVLFMTHTSASKQFIILYYFHCDQNFSFTTAVPRNPKVRRQRHGFREEFRKKLTNNIFGYNYIILQRNANLDN